jgi:hypothetical protein
MNAGVQGLTNGARIHWTHDARPIEDHWRRDCAGRLDCGGQRPATPGAMKQLPENLQ